MIDGQGTGKRPETGPMVFEGDWPGVFIRGDSAFGYLTALNGFLELQPPTEGNSTIESNFRYAIKELIGLLHSSNVSPRDLRTPYLNLPIQRMKDFVDAKLPAGVRSESSRVTSKPEFIHRLTLEALLDGFAKVERRNKKVTDIWLCEDHYTELKAIGGEHLTDEVAGQETRCKLWGATVHVVWKIPLNNFVIIGEDDDNLVDGVITHKKQLTRF
jgi:hypothetical protein